MSIRGNQARADRLVEEFLAERRARRQHGARAKAIFLRRLSSPGGLAICFVAGAATGLRAGHRAQAEGGWDGEEPRNGAEKGYLQRISESPAGNIVLRLAAATLVRYVLAGGGGGDTGDSAGSAAPDAGGP